MNSSDAEDTVMMLGGDEREFFLCDADGCELVVCACVCTCLLGRDGSGVVDEGGVTGCYALSSGVLV